MICVCVCTVIQLPAWHLNIYTACNKHGLNKYKQGTPSAGSAACSSTPRPALQVPCQPCGAVIGCCLWTLTWGQSVFHVVLEAPVCPLSASRCHLPHRHCVCVCVLFAYLYCLGLQSCTSRRRVCVFLHLLSFECCALKAVLICLWRYVQVCQACLATLYLPAA